jgi:DNA helicase-2/ATP-dependent DNA helicase PcrA
MQYIADLHIHSPYSRATSKSSNLAGLAAWSAVKGIDVIGTGDFTHPGWFRQLRENLQPAEPGFFRFKETSIPPIFESVPVEKALSCRFILTAEISSIYKRHGSVRKIHNILFVPDFETASRINARLAGIGNIESDGRPILGLDAHDLLEIMLELAPEGFLVPAHIWTPWFSLFGSRSGFDSIDECFGDLSRYVFALETGLSSDPEMNRLVSALDRFTLISNSDCHSPGKLGREANIFTCGFNFFSMRDALKNQAVGGFQGTIEFFPEEGKYHHDGHRKCGINLDPQETRKLGNICPVCSRPLTIGVMHRVMELADRETSYFPSNAPRYYSLIPLAEVLGEIFSRGHSSKTVSTEYGKLIRIFDSEFNLLLNVPVDEISARYSPVLGEAVNRIRKGEVIKKAGFDGEFGVIKVFEQGELKELVGQSALFKTEKPGKKIESPSNKPSLLEFMPSRREPAPRTTMKSLNTEQVAAVTAKARHIVVTAGPGTGKTHTLVARIERLVKETGASEGDITAITFTNRAAGEMRERLGRVSGLNAANLFIGTFHAFCLQLLRQDKPDLTVIDEKGRDRLLSRLFPKLTTQDLAETRKSIEAYYLLFVTGGEHDSEERMNAHVAAYLKELVRRDGIDLSGLIPRVVYRLNSDENFFQKTSARVKYLFIDEFQDLNRAQYELIRKLAGTGSVFAIGDPDQAIYGFRGSSPEFFHLFINEFAAETLALGKNYRSTIKILEAAAAVINYNHTTETKHHTTIIPNHTEHGSIELYQAQSPQAEAEFVVRRIEELMGGISHFSIDSGRGKENQQAAQRSFRDFSVFYRLTQQSEYLREALERRGIPFQVVNVPPFFMQQEIRPIYYWIRAAAANPETIEAVVYLELLRTFPGVGDSSLALLEDQLPIGGFDDFFLLADKVSLPKALRERVQGMQRNLLDFKEKILEKGLAESIAEVMEYLRVKAKSADAKRFLELAGSFGSDLPGFAAHLQRNEAATVYDDQAEAVALMTVHGAKGLEFPVVFITGMEEGIFPCEIPGMESAEITEERRLFYVGMTRARDSLILSSAASRPIYGRYQSRPVSRFVNEIPASLIEHIRHDMTKRKKTAAKQMKLF